MTDRTAGSNADLDVRESDDGLVIRATIDRPDERNALNKTVIEGFGRCIGSFRGIGSFYRMNIEMVCSGMLRVFFQDILQKSNDLRSPFHWFSLFIE